LSKKDSSPQSPNEGMEPRGQRSFGDKPRGRFVSFGCSSNGDAESHACDGRNSPCLSKKLLVRESIPSPLKGQSRACCRAELRPPRYRPPPSRLVLVAN